MQDGHPRGGEEGDTGQGGERPHLSGESQFGDVGPEGSQHESDGEKRTVEHGAGNENEHHRDELGDADTDSAERLDPQLGEERDRFRRAGEFEEEGLAEDDGDENTENPGGNVFCFHRGGGFIVKSVGAGGLFHFDLSFR